MGMDTRHAMVMFLVKYDELLIKEFFTIHGVDGSISTYFYSSGSENFKNPDPDPQRCREGRSKQEEGKKREDIIMK